MGSPKARMGSLGDTPQGESRDLTILPPSRAHFCSKNYVF